MRKRSGGPGRESLVRALGICGGVVCWLWLLLLGSVPSPAHGEEGANSAWLELRRHHPELIDQLGPEERMILHVLSYEQVMEWLDGVPPQAIFLADGRSLEEILAKRVEGSGFTMPRFALSSFGGASSDGPFTLFSVGGEPIVSGESSSSGGGFTLSGGMLGVPPAPPLFADGFESGDTSRWGSSNMMSPPSLLGGASNRGDRR